MLRIRITSAAIATFVLLPACSAIIDTNPDGVVSDVGGKGTGKGGKDGGSSPSSGGSATVGGNRATVGGKTAGGTGGTAKTNAGSGADTSGEGGLGQSGTPGSSNGGSGGIAATSGGTGASVGGSTSVGASGGATGAGTGGTGNATAAGTPGIGGKATGGVTSVGGGVGGKISTGGVATTFGGATGVGGKTTGGVVATGGMATGGAPAAVGGASTGGASTGGALSGVGESCGGDDQCTSNHCVSGICCSTACGACNSCSTGSCLPVTNGASCGSGQVCSGGSCQTGCWIAGGFRSAGDTTGNCQICDPTKNTTAWSNNDSASISCGSCGGTATCVNMQLGPCSKEIGTYWRDNDGDGYGNRLVASTQACSAPIGFVTNANDCDDSNAQWYPGKARCETFDANALTTCSSSNGAESSTTCANGCAGGQCRSFGTVSTAGLVTCATLTCPASSGCSFTAPLVLAPTCGTTAANWYETCDGPNDCSGGLVCCHVTPGNNSGESTVCMASGTCPYTNPGGSGRLVCDTLGAACANGGSCKIATGSYLSIYECQ